MNSNKNNDTPHFNIADIIIIISIIAVITALALRIYNVFGTNDDVTKVRIEFEVEELATETLSLKEEAKLYNTLDDSYVGFLEAFEITNSIRYAYNEKGELVKAMVPGKSDVNGTIVIECVKTENGFYLGGTQLLSEGSTLSLYSTTREMNFKIKKITEIKLDENGKEVTTITTVQTSAAITTAPIQN